MTRPTEPLKSSDATFANHRLGRLHHLFHDSCLLVADSSARRILALSPAFAVRDTLASLDRNVDRYSWDHGPVAQPPALRKPLDLDSRRFAILRWCDALQVIPSPVQSGATRRTIRDPTRPSPAEPRHHWRSRARPTSRLSRPSLRDAGLERWHGPGSLLGAHRIRDPDWSDHDSDGRQRTGDPLWRRISPLSIRRTRRSAQGKMKGR